MGEVKIEQRHREAAATLIPFASAWVDDPSHTYGLATPELSLLTKAAKALAAAEAAGRREAEGIEVRASVRWFAEQMELALRKNDNKGGWHDMDPYDLANRVDDEADELREAVEDHPMADDDAQSGVASMECITEAADVANMAMMVADHFRDGGPSVDQGRTLSPPSKPGAR